jgi:hypothetical protein
MLKTLSSLSIAGILACIPFLTHAQFKVTVAHQTYYIDKFSDDTTTYQNDFRDEGVIPSIRKSKYEIEIRYYIFADYGSPDESYCIVMRGNKDSLYAAKYFLKRFIYKKAGAEPVDSGKVIHWFDQPNIHPDDGIGVHIKKINMPSYTGKLLQTLIDNHITDIPTKNRLAEILAKRGVVLKSINAYDCCTDILFEVKIGKHFRNFTVGNGYVIDEHQAKELHNELAILKLFAELTPLFND